MLLIDLLYELLMQSALFSVYFTMFVFALGLTAIFVVVPRLFEGRVVVKTGNDYRLSQRRFQLPSVVGRVFIVWFIRVFKRADVVQDLDEDAISLSFLKAFYKRGGEKWRSTYSRMDENILVLF